MEEHIIICGGEGILDGIDGELADIADCLVDPDGAFKREYGECLFGELTPEEELTSDRMVRAWTNFAYHG